MTPRPDASSARRDDPDVVWDGFIAGALGAVAVALWFLVLDLSRGDPLHTPALLGTALFHGGDAAAQMEEVETGVVMLYSGIHLTLFATFGTAAAGLLRSLRGRRARRWALGVALGLLVAGFHLLVRTLAPGGAGGPSTWSLLAGHGLAALIMGAYLLVRNPALLPGDADGGWAPSGG